MKYLDTYKSTQKWTNPVDPMVVKLSQNHSRSQTASRVHTGASEWYGKQVTGGDGQTNGQWSGALDTGRVELVTSCSEDDHDEDSSDDHLHHHTLTRCHMVTKICQSQSC